MNILRQYEDIRYILILICSFDIFRLNKRKIKKNLGRLQIIKFLRKKIRKIQKKNFFILNIFFRFFFQSVDNYILKISTVQFFKIHNRSREILILLQKISFYLMLSSSYKVSFCKMIISVYSLIANSVKFISYRIKSALFNKL